MKKNSGKTGIMLRFGVIKDIAKLPMEYLRDILLTICDYADPESPAFDQEPDWKQIFPDMDSNTKQFLLSSWGFISREIQKDDESFIYKNSKRQYNSFCTNASRWGKLDKVKDIITYEEWVQIGSPGWRQWDRLGRPVPAPEPLNTSVPTVPARQHRADDTQNYRLEISPDTPAAVPVPDSVSDAAPWTNSTPADATEHPAPDAADYPAQKISGSQIQHSAADLSGVQSDVPELPAVLQDESPTLHIAFAKWTRYWEQTNGKKMPELSRCSLAEQFVEYAYRFTPPDVADLVDETISNAYKSIPWDRLERNARRDALSGIPGYGAYSIPLSG